VHKTRTVAVQGTIDVENVAGSVDIVGGDGALVDISGTRVDDERRHPPVFWRRPPLTRCFSVNLACLGLLFMQAARPEPTVRSMA
jgi:hypothetical protein